MVDGDGDGIDNGDGDGDGGGDDRGEKNELWYLPGNLLGI